MYPFPYLPPTLSREIFAELCRSLPPPADETQSARDARDTIAMAAVAGLNPADAAEAMLAVQVVLAEAHARDCLRLATKHCNDLPTAFRCRSQAAAQMRQMHQALRALRQSQAIRPDAQATHQPAEEQPAEPQADAPHSVAVPRSDAPGSDAPTRPPVLYPLTVRRDEPTPWFDRYPPGPSAADPIHNPIAATATQLGLPRFAWAWVKPPRNGHPINGDESHMKQH